MSSFGIQLPDRKFDLGVGLTTGDVTSDVTYTLVESNPTAIIINARYHTGSWNEWVVGTLQRVNPHNPSDGRFVVADKAYYSSLIEAVRDYESRSTAPVHPTDPEDGYRSSH